MSVLVVVAVIEEAQLPTFDVTELHYDSIDTLTGERVSESSHYMHPLQKLTYSIDCFFFMNSLESKCG